MKVTKIDINAEVIDIDLFTVFGLFNKGITHKNRLTIIESIIKEFDKHLEVSQIFNGVPVLNNMRATFYEFKESRKSDDIDNLWHVFESALELADNDNESTRDEFIKIYNVVSKQRGIRWNLTMALFWIRPNYFINLDRTNRSYLLNSKDMPVDFVEIIKPKIKNLPNGKDYLMINDSCKNMLSSDEFEFNTLPELSYEV
ncbi:hypothetical protein [Atopobacter phocae]|uniref:hypothetical protein n=1 Tax=Atopobacter phocae TaxID=136492 RepID=UPI000472957A|nr:hypothetical protein [Atopobacter phocae]